jgi:hypothetical protein
MDTFDRLCNILLQLGAEVITDESSIPLSEYLIYEDEDMDIVLERKGDFYDNEIMAKGVGGFMTYTTDYLFAEDYIEADMIWDCYLSKLGISKEELK